MTNFLESDPYFIREKYSAIPLKVSPIVEQAQSFGELVGYLEVASEVAQLGKILTFDEFRNVVAVPSASDNKQ